MLRMAVSDVEDILGKFAAMRISKPKLDLVVNGNTLKAEKYILCFLYNPLLRVLWVIVADNKLGNFGAESSCAVADDKIVKRNRLQGRVTRHLDMGMMWCRRLGELWTTLQTPLNVEFVALDLLLALEPGRHLRVLVAAIRSPICILCHIDMEPLRVLRVVVVRCTEELDGVRVVAESMKFRDIEVIANTKVLEDAPILVETVESIVKEFEGGRGCCRALSRVILQRRMNRVLSEVKEVEKSPNGADEADGRKTTRQRKVHDETKEDPAHVAVLGPRHALQAGDTVGETT